MAKQQSAKTSTALPQSSQHLRSDSVRATPDLNWPTQNQYSVLPVSQSSELRLFHLEKLDGKLILSADHSYLFNLLWEKRTVIYNTQFTESIYSEESIT